VFRIETLIWKACWSVELVRYFSDDARPRRTPTPFLVKQGKSNMAGR
jgi:hypothetical protein